MGTWLHHALRSIIARRPRKRLVPRCHTPPSSTSTKASAPYYRATINRWPRRNHRTAWPPHGRYPARFSRWRPPPGMGMRADRIRQAGTAPPPRTPTVQRAIRYAEQVSSQSSQRQFTKPENIFRHARRPRFEPSDSTNHTNLRLPLPPPAALVRAALSELSSPLESHHAATCTIPIGRRYGVFLQSLRTLTWRPSAVRKTSLPA